LSEIRGMIVVDVSGPALFPPRIDPHQADRNRPQPIDIGPVVHSVDGS